MNPAEIAKIKPDLANICEEHGSFNPTGLVQASCYHALGHLAMYITRADLNQTTNLCSQLAKKADGRDYSQVCYDGAFMQIYQPLEPDDFALIKGKVPTKETLVAFCNSFPSPQKDSCWTESWPMSFQELKDPKNLVSFCTFPATPTGKDRCYLSLIYVMTAEFNFDQGKIESYCLGLPAERKGGCFANASSRMIETDTKNVNKSIALCATAASEGVGEACYQELLSYSTYNFHLGSKEFFALCDALPTSWKQTCLKQNNRS